MTERVTEQFAKLEQDRAVLFARIEGLTAEQLCWRPSEAEWSVSCVLGHLILAEQLSLGYIRKKMQDPKRAAGSGPSRQGQVEVADRAAALAPEVQVAAGCR